MVGIAEPSFALAAWSPKNTHEAAAACGAANAYFRIVEEGGRSRSELKRVEEQAVWCNTAVRAIVERECGERDPGLGWMQDLRNAPPSREIARAIRRALKESGACA